MKRAQAQSGAILRLNYIEAAAYFYFRAVGHNEQLVSALYRAKAGSIQQALEAYRIPVPSPEEVYAYAKEKWQPHQLHAAPITEAWVPEDAQ